MACFDPWYGWEGPNGQVVNLRKASQLTPYGIGPLAVPCGNCIGCRRRHKRDWAIRIQHEARYHKQNCFITLTYDDAHLPANGDLHVDDWQKFIKRLRKSLASRGIRVRFYHCSEYGGQTKRPHLHAALHGVDFTFDRVPHPTARGNNLFQSPTLDAAWQRRGMAVVAPLTSETARYVAGYVTKKLGSQADTLEERAYVWDSLGRVEAARRPEFATMSQGYGKKFFEEHWKEIYANDSIVIDGFEFPVPRYYDKLLAEVDPDLLEQVKFKRREKFEENRLDHNYERLQSRKLHHELVDKRNKRDRAG